MTEDLAKRIDRLESIEAIKKLKHVYMNHRTPIRLRSSRSGSGSLIVGLLPCSSSSGFA